MKSTLTTASKSRKGMGGPKTAEGKAKAAKNSIKHGLTAKLPINPTEQELIQAFENQLLGHYQTSSPLIQMQIGRMAQCRAKLAMLAMREEALQKLMLEDFNSNPDLVFERMANVSERAKMAAKQYLQYDDFVLPCGLKREQVNLLAQEQAQFYGEIHSATDIELHLPHLNQFLAHFTPKGLVANPDPLLKLKAIHERSAQFLKSLSRDTQELEDELSLYLYKSLSTNMKNVGNSDEEDADPGDSGDREMDKNDEFWAGDAVTAQTQGKKKIQQSQDPQKEPTTLATLEEQLSATKKSLEERKCIKNQLAIFSELEQFCQIVQSTVNQFYVMRDLLLQAKSLPVLESENTLRYQIAIERRLSQLTGEFMVMLKMETH